MKAICQKIKYQQQNLKYVKLKTHVIKFLKDSKPPLVVKADGLAAGKGVSICKTKNEVIKTFQ